MVNNTIIMTELISAIIANDYSKVNYLISLGVDINEPLPEDRLMPPVGYAIAYSCSDIVDLLIKSGATVENFLINQLPYLSSLVRIAERSNYEIVNLLILSGLDINHPLEEGDTILHKSVEKYDVNFIKFLLKLGANPNQINEYGWTPLMSLICLQNSSKFQVGEQLNLLDLFWDSTAKIVIQDYDGRNLLEIAEDYPQAHEKILDYIRERL
ncbi:MAG: hypothetical protein F6K30_23895 [Cyanothece sp. SIO2G6]|nr:hypothetical protein [Cyanothece sp. SIO2G6]